MTDDTGGARIAAPPARAISQPEPAGACPVCGAPPGGGAVGSLVLRARIPQPVAGALLRTRALSPRERVVFELLGLGHGNRSIARELSVSERTVKRHITVILAKLGLESRLQAGLAALIVSSATPSPTGAVPSACRR